ncbi:sushi, von Willebrand factor type A, EGF and pentraxin domain-containing protein 1 [Strongylocentrotus purpuratus]|uniref:Uncharacterized protein n=1 Tax=Strongylocentrotus purpuratus TaxID=7668 RepID=A0A7M7HL72_STRPU|nr:sushi, von Willebrand factor type A, EGF and pentraxin domain-containing protein 1 [Strongylocentrotus purpuratus]
MQFLDDSSSIGRRYSCSLREICGWHKGLALWHWVHCMGGSLRVNKDTKSAEASIPIASAGGGQLHCNMTMQGVIGTLLMSLLFVGTLVRSERSDIRLVGGVNNHEGRVEVRIDGEWGTVCDDGWGLTDAHVACRQLGFGPATDIITDADEFGEGTGPIHLDDLGCYGDEASLVACIHRGLGKNNCNHAEDAGVRCSTSPPTSGNADIRLDAGGSLLEGRIRIKIGGEWGTVCDDRWDLADASVVCQQLGLGSALEVRSFGPGSGPILLDDLACTGTESSLTSCSYTDRLNCNHNEDAGAVCSGSTGAESVHQGIRLVGGSSEYEGRVEVYINDKWGTVCDDLWSLTDANVACRHMGFGRAISTPGATAFGQGSGSIMMDNVECHGDETSLLACPYQSIHNCGHAEDAGVVCAISNSTKVQSTIRLVGGSTEYEGRVEVSFGDRWGTVCDDMWSLIDANVACRQLGYGSAIAVKDSSVFGGGTGPIFMDNVECTGRETSLDSCPFQSSHNCAHVEDAGIVCASPDILEAYVNQSTIRLVGGTTEHEGRVEVYIGGQWGTVCDDVWTLADANIACRELGFGPAVSAPGVASFGEGSGLILMDDVDCNGHETSLISCEYSRNHNCGHSEDAGVVCRSSASSVAKENLNIRLVGGSTELEGRVEVHVNGQWGTVCDDLWTLTDANVACKQLGLGPATSAPGASRFGRGVGSILMDNVECRGDESALAFCQHHTSHNCGHQEDAGVVCSPRNGESSNIRSIRLVGSSSPYEGRVELLIAGVWGTVCDDMWDRKDGMVACRQLGYGQVIAATSSARYGPGSGPIHLDDLRCAGGESMLVSCRHAGNTHNCNHGEDAGLTCSPPDGVEPPTEPAVSLRLVDGFSPFEGRLEVYMNGKWGTVCDDMWSLTDADVACRQLGFGSALSVRGSTYGEGSGRILMDDVECTGTETTLISCQYSTTHNCRHAEDVGIICNQPEGAQTDDVRLVGGSSPNEGRVEILINGEWGTVCDDMWDMTDANVVCRQLGFGVAFRALSSFGLGSGPISMDNVECDGTETSLLSCTHLGSHNCQHQEDVGIVCQPQDAVLTAAPAVECPILSHTNHPLRVSCTNGTIVGSLCTYSCDDGFILQGSSERTCQTSGSWHPNGEGIPVCEAEVVTVAPVVECPAIGRPTYPLAVSCSNNTQEGSMCTYACVDGFSLEGSPDRVCQASGSWSPSLEITPICKGVSCPPLALEHGTTLCTNDWMYLSACMPVCDIGYEIDRHRALQCISSGNWTEELPTCQLSKCPELPIVANGVKTCTNDTHLGSTCNVTCADGFRLVGPVSRKCEGRGSWSRYQPVCQDIRCPTLTSPHFGSLACTQGSRHGSVCTSTCGVGYRVIGSTATKCNPDGTWTQDIPTCELITCGPEVEAPLNGSVACFISGRVCIYSCNNGFDLTPLTSVVRTCEAHGWSKAAPTCLDRRAPVFQTCPEDAMTFISDPMQETATVNWLAPSALDHSNNKIVGVYVSGPAPGASLEGGSYPVVYVAEDASGNTANCRFTVVVSVIRCPELSDEDLVKVNCSHGYLRDSICRFSCSAAGYEVVGPDMTQCVMDRDEASWSSARPSCTDYSAPVFTNCPSSQVVFAEINQTTSSVRWPEPRATDNSNNALHVVMTAGNGSGVMRPEGTILEAYEAVDESGNRAECSFNVTVKVIRCAQLDSDFISACSGTVLGSVCHFSCPEGYLLQGHSSKSCQRNGFDGIWSNQLSFCLDSQAPVFTRRPEPIEITAPPLEMSAFVSWEVPEAEDQDPNVLVFQIAGPAPDTELPEGFYLVRYMAMDSAGNEAVYTFNITVKVVQCSDPEPEVNEDVGVICNRGNLLGSTCVYSCPVGYDLIGSQSTTCVMMDDDSTMGRWNTTTTPSCQARSCPSLATPPAAIVSGCVTDLGNSSTYGTNCTFTCPAGYFGVGEAVKFCQADGTWSTTGFACQKRHCVGLGGNGIFTSIPHQCMGFPEYEDVCVVACLLPGYQLRGPGSAEFQCMQNGTWDQALDDFTCLDIEPPELLTCPESFIVDKTNPDGVEVTFDIPTARDNSNSSLRIVTSPENLTSPHFIFQDSVLSFEFFDDTNNSIKCTFDVQVKEEFGVDILYCPDDITVETEKEANVTWSRPVFRGENASNIQVTGSVNGTSAMLQIGFHSIEYTAVNKFTGKESVCRFNITVKPLPCPPLDTPLNGALSCRKWETIEICSMSCKEGYDIPRLPSRQQPPTLYTCSASQGSSREWKPNDNVVDCSGLKGRLSYLPAGLIYYEGDCGQLVTQQNIASALTTLIQASTFGDLCNDKQCSVTDVTVTCGPLDHLPEPPPAQRRRRRARRDAMSASIPSGAERRNLPRASWATNVTMVSFDISTRHDIDNDAVDDEPTSDADDRLAEIEENLSRLVHEIILTGTADGMEGDMMEKIAQLPLDDASLVLGDIKSACDQGYVPQTGSPNRCVACPRGYISGGDAEMCMPCTTGSYQDQSAQSACKPCPAGQTTPREGAKNINECRDQCSPGSFSPSGLVPCLPCDRQSFQSQAGQRSCDRCPTNQKTYRYGAISQEECTFYDSI